MKDITLNDRPKAPKRLKKYRVVSIERKKTHMFGYEIVCKFIVQSRVLLSPIWINEGWTTNMVDAMDYIYDLKSNSKVVYRD